MEAVPGFSFKSFCFANTLHVPCEFRLSCTLSLISFLHTLPPLFFPGESQASSSDFVCGSIRPVLEPTPRLWPGEWLLDKGIALEQAPQCPCRAEPASHKRCGCSPLLNGEQESLWRPSLLLILFVCSSGWAEMGERYRWDWRSFRPSTYLRLFVLGCRYFLQ
ncbi:hypothetical protein BU26DRAFT_24552 [Trematosphaeria pertusa]|uniref:Uncharacterized protein n=1 Tax=Trematosphaeria pertusa TaxID=390896 RepID=A0A6A6J2X0_9PLEO|nr:uncharacterized protein BU26DRAFT_24552 [Trematosphaeria pertusa]KAF2256562.1 hypothetical protein BU26DRAFT_24552 [Trematosphaeria pertusa]